MGPNPKQFKKKLLAASISSCILSSVGVVAQEEMTEEVIVTGIRESIATSINVKRSADTVVDAITAENIGKLPDVTISDSLQRISGIQIRRSAGEGGAINIRGLPQVITQLNGEQYLGANSVVSTQPDFGDIPSQLFKGAEIYKSATADLGVTGITGTVNLKTYRPFDFDSGLTTAGSIELQRGEETAETDPVISGLVNWQNESVGFLFAATYANVNLSNSYNGINTGSPGDAGWTSNFPDTAVVGFADEGRIYVGSQGFSAWNQVTERERLGLNSSFQADLGGGFTLTTDFFYTEQDEYNRKIGLSATNKWQGDDGINWFTPTSERATGAMTDGGREFHAWSSATLSPRRLKSFTQNDVYFSTSRNANIQLDYDDGGAFTGSFRAVVGSASRDLRHGYNEGDLTNGISTLGRTTNLIPSELCGQNDVVVGDEGGCLQEINPLGYGEDPTLTYDTTGTHPTWGGFDNPLSGGLGAGATVADYMANLDSYNVGAFSSENNENAEGDLTAFSIKGSYAFDDSFITSVDAGIRSGQRSASFERYNLFSPAPLPTSECEAQWKATDVLLNSTAAGACQDGEVVDGEFMPYVALPHVNLNQYNNVKWVTDFGPVNGIPGVWAVDPADYDDPEAFHNRVFGSTTKQTIPGSTFSVDMDDLTYYIQANFESGNLSGNLGVRIIETDLTVKQNIAGGGIPYGNTAYDTGDLLTKRSYTDTLPSLNLAYQAGEDVVLRLAYTEAMTPLNLDQYGDGLTLNTAIDSTPSSPTFNQFIVTGGSLNGNPQLDPWRSENYDLSAEWYLADTSLLSIAVFRVEVDSFVEPSTELQFQPDADGVIRRQVNISLNTQGEGGKLEGVELSGKLAFSDFLDGENFFSNFGVDTNFTYSPSEGSDRDIFGNTNIFPDNSEEQFNLIGWYETDRFSARVAYNYRSERLVTAGGAAGGLLNVYQEDTAYVDISASYDITDEIAVYINGSNVTGEFEDYYLEFPDQLGFQNYYETRYTLGVRARF